MVSCSYAAVLELKNFERPIFGDQNGVWAWVNPAGRQIPYSGGNPWQQTLDQKFALSDEMKRYGGKHHEVPAPLGRAYYTEFDAFVCIYPQIHPASRVTPGDHRATVRSYADVIEILRSSSKPSSWSISDWKGFAEKHLNLTLTTVEGATNPKIREAHEKIAAYRGRIETFIGTALPPLFIGNPTFGQQLVQRLLEPANFLIVGPSGSTKTFHLHHLMLAMSSKGEELPVLIEAKKYRGGDFWTMLKHGIAPLFRGDPKELLEAIRACALRPVLIIDALNECSASYLSELKRGAQAFALQYDARVVLASQTETDLVGDLQSTVIPLPLPDLIHKRYIYAYHARLAATPDVDLFCAGFTNAYDLTVAGLCHNSGAHPESRPHLYDRYVRRCLSEHASISSALLRNIAGEMAKALSTVWSRDIFETVAEQFLLNQNASLEILDELRRCRLIELTEDTFSFEHELLLDYFKAESLRRQAGNIQELACELKKPRNHQLVEIIISRYSDGKDIATILASANEATVLCRVLAGNCGSAARDVVLEQCEEFMDAALKDLPNVGLTVETRKDNDGRDRYTNLGISGNRSWTSYDALLCNVIASNLEHERLQSRFLELFDMTEWTLRGLAHRVGQTFRSKDNFVWEEAVRLFGGLLQYGTVDLPCVTILSIMRTRLMYPRHYKNGLPIRARLLERVHRIPCSDFALLALFEDLQHGDKDTEIRTMLDLGQRGLDSGIYILQVHALELLQCIRPTHEAQRIRKMLESFQTDNIMVNSLRLETMALHGALEPLVSVEDALSEMRAIIAQDAAEDPAIVEIAKLSNVPPMQVIAERAYGYLAAIFEDVFQGVYSEAYFELSRDEKRDILCLAAMAPDLGFNSDWILQELLEYGGERALPIYQHYASVVEGESLSSQHAVGVFVLGIKGCARWSETPPVYRKADSPEHRAWRAIGEILFWVLRESDRDANSKLIENAWVRFDGPMTLAAADVLYQLSHAQWRLGEQDTAVDLIAMFPKQVKPILERSIDNRGTLPTIFRFGGSRDQSLMQFLIDSLGRIGDLATLPILRTTVDDPELGKNAIQAVDSIQKRVLSQGTGRVVQ